MLSHLSPAVAQVIIDDRLRVSRERRRLQRPPAEVGAAHRRQRALVRASLLLSAREDRPTERRWA
jgi:hypothetical protein